MPAMLHGCLALVLGLVASGACLADDTYTCPAKVRLSSGKVQAEDVPPSYTSHVSQSFIRLSGVSVFDGPPSEGAALKPTTFTGGGRIIKWTFAGPFEKGKWVSCDYSNGLVRVAVRAEDSTLSCTATVRKFGAPTATEVRVLCK